MTKTKTISETDDNPVGKKMCGIIMPISNSEGYIANHWLDVRLILEQAISDANFDSRIVSTDSAIGLIHERIVTNLHQDQMIVCDVSSKNPNVMLELGLRLAFDKPVIIIKDELTRYEFDTSPIEHLLYPSTLRFGEIGRFKEELTRKLTATYEKSLEPDYTSFLKSFGRKIVATKLDEIHVSSADYIIEQLQFLREDINSMKNEKTSNGANSGHLIDANKRLTIASLYYSIKGNYPNATDGTLYGFIRSEFRRNGLDVSRDEYNEFLKKKLA